MNTPSRTGIRQAHSELGRELGLNSRSLARAIFNADVPEQYVRTFPAQSLYMAVKENGLASSADLIEIATLEQCRIMMDFDLWERDHLNEDNLWEWLGLTDENNDLSLLQKILKFIDYKIIALLISRYVDTVTSSEPADRPPGEGYYTPDKGYTWIHLNVEDSTRHFLLARLLALIFETDTELFYQLISIPQVATPAGLEEDSYTERTKRLASEGIPDQEMAHHINAPIDQATIMKDLKAAGRHIPVEDISSVEPLIYDGTTINPLGSLFNQIGNREEIESELTLISNAAIVFWAIEFYDQGEVSQLLDRIKGAVNIGLETAMRLSQRSAHEVYEILGLQKLFRFGLSELQALRRLALKVADDSIKDSSGDNITISIIACARERFPRMPVFFNPDGSIRDLEGSLPSGHKAIETVQELESLKRFFQDRFKIAL